MGKSNQVKVDTNLKARTHSKIYNKVMHKLVRIVPIKWMLTVHRSNLKIQVQQKTKKSRKKQQLQQTIWM